MKWKVLLLAFVFAFSIFLGIWGVCYAHAQGKELVCAKLEIKVLDSTQLAFVTAQRVSRFLKENYPSLVGTKLLDINTAELEAAIHSMSGVQDVQAYYGVDGVLRVDLQQRKPLFRIISQTGASCYVDCDGYTFPVDRYYTARVPLVTGNIGLPDGEHLAPMDGVLDGLIPLRDSVVRCKEKNWAQLFELVRYLDADKFWRAQFAQIYVDSWMRIELIPRVGGQLIVLGSVENYQYKLNKLYSFYSALLTDERLEQYAVIDLQYSNQVVCQRR